MTKSMPLKTIFTVLIILFSYTLSEAQCECTDCPVPILANVIDASLMNISGASNNTLGINGQQLCMICISMDHDAINEVNMTLIAPNGSSVDLIMDTGINFNQNLTFDICFVSCDQSASPDSGHADVFDSSENWGMNMTYDGTYYPSSGCLEDLTGDVNGTWELEVEDVFFLYDGVLLDWYMVFTDDNGLNCDNADDCDIAISCIAEGGEINEPSIVDCEGDSDLDLDLEASYPNNNEPPTPDFDYSWVIADADTDIIEDISEDSDMTSYPPGNYTICGLSFLVLDEPLIPSPNGSITIDDIEDDIDDEDYCADLSDDCVDVTIEALPVAPILNGPDGLCVDETGTYTIMNYDPNITYLINFIGGVSIFNRDEETIEIAWFVGPAEICVTVQSACGDIVTCIQVDLSSGSDDLEINGNLNPCPGSTEFYFFDPSAGPGESYNVTLTGGTIISQSDDDVEILWPSSPDDYEFCIELIGVPCNGMPLCETVEVKDDFVMPDELNSPIELCDGSIGISQIDGDNDVLEYAWSGDNITIIDGQDTDMIEYIVTGPGISTICLEVTTDCGTQGPLCEDIEVIEVPIPFITDVDPGCSFSFTLDSNADSSNDIEWVLINGSGTAEIDDSNASQTAVTVSESGTYLFQLEESNNGCAATDMTTVEVLENLEISSLNYNCNQDNQYTVDFVIESGEAPYFVDGEELSSNFFESSLIESGDSFEFVVVDDLGCTITVTDMHTCPCMLDVIDISEECNNTSDGYVLTIEISGGESPYAASIPGDMDDDIFTSELIPSGEEYMVTFVDNNGCESAIVSGNKLCDCISNSGFMSSMLVSICVSTDSIIVDAVQQSALDPDDIGYYVLHTSPTSTLGDIISVNEDPIFNYINDIILDSTYYVSYVVGNNLNDLVDNNDPCLDVSVGQPVIWISPPIVNSGIDQASCSRDFVLSAMPDVGVWNMINTPSNSAFSMLTSTDANLSLSLDEVGEYSLSWTADNGSCIASDTLTLTINESPLVISSEVECNPDLLTYALEIFIEDSSNAITVNGQSSSDIYSIDSLVAAVDQSFVIENEFGCMTTLIVSDINCECDNEAGTINSAEQNLCSFDLIDVNISNGDYILEEGDTVAYVLHEGSAAQIGNVIAVSYGDDIPFDNATMDFGNTYFLNVIVGEFVNGAIDLDDSCLQLSEGVPVVFTTDVVVTLEGQLDGCIGDVVSYTVASTFYPIDIILESTNGNILNAEIFDEQTQVFADIESPSEEWSVQSVDHPCFTNAEGVIQVIGQEPTVFELRETFEICNNPLFGSTIDESDMFVGNEVLFGGWTFNGVGFNNGVLDFTDLVAGDYMLTYSTIGFDNLCSGMMDGITVTVVDCDCPVFNIPNVNICSMPAEYNLTDYDVQGWEGIWTIINTNNVLSPPRIEDDKIIVDDSNFGEFEIVYTITDPNYPANCDLSTSFILSIELQMESGVQSDFTSYCEDASTDINLFDLLSGYDIGGSWLLASARLPSEMINTSILSVGDNILTYEIAATQNCPVISTEVIVTIEEALDVDISSSNILCFGDDDGEIIITIENPNGDEVICYLDNVIQDDGKDITGLPAGTYQIYATRGACTSAVEEIIITEPSPVSVQLGEDMEVEVLSEVTISAIVNILESDINSITWTDLQGIIELDSLELTSIFENSNTISISIEDDNGCIAEDEININVLQAEIEPVYIPNIISWNSNDSNSVFSMQNTGQVQLVNKFYIYDRWGNNVYKRDNLLPDDEDLSWDGYYNDKLVEQGVYVYLIELTYLDDSVDRFAGDITYIR